LSTSFDIKNYFLIITT